MRFTSSGKKKKKSKCHIYHQSKFMELQDSQPYTVPLSERIMKEIFLEDISRPVKDKKLIWRKQHRSTTRFAFYDSLLSRY